MSWVLAVDFGTSNTTAAFADDGGTPQLLQVENSQYLPSVVMAGAEGNLLTGKAAARQVVLQPERAERVPKRALVNGSQVVLGGREFAATELVGAVLSKVYAEAVRFHGGTSPAAVILTHPARWSQPLKDRLGEAAMLAGIGDAVFVSEPAAAAWFYAPPVRGQVVAVFDLGGGTLDTAVLRAADGGFEIAGPPGGDADLGGEDFDELLMDRVQEMARALDEELWAEMTAPGTRAARDRANLRSEVTAAKEALSEHLSYEVVVPGFAEALRVTRPAFEELIAEAVERAVDEMRRTISAAGVEPAHLAALYLTGGSSRIPLISGRLWAASGIQPQLRDDPKAVVVLGALKAAAEASTRGRGSATKPGTRVKPGTAAPGALAKTGAPAKSKVPAPQKPRAGKSVAREEEWRLTVQRLTFTTAVFRLSSLTHPQYYDITIKKNVLNSSILVNGVIELKYSQIGTFNLPALSKLIGATVAFTIGPTLGKFPRQGRAYTVDINGAKASCFSAWILSAAGCNADAQAARSGAGLSSWNETGISRATSG